MLKHIILLFFLYGIKYANGRPQEQTPESKEFSKNGIKKNEVGANGLEYKSEEVLKNFQNPVLEYLLHENSGKTTGFSKNKMIREIRHSQTLLIPYIPRAIQSNLPVTFLSQLPMLATQNKPAEIIANSKNSPKQNFNNYFKGNIEPLKIHESVVASPLLQLNKNSKASDENSTRAQLHPSVTLLNILSKNGTLKKFISGFQRDLVENDSSGKEAMKVGDVKSENYKTIENGQYAVNDFIADKENKQTNFLKNQVEFFHQGQMIQDQMLRWPLADYFPFLSIYNTVSSVIEYIPDNVDNIDSQINHKVKVNEKDSRKEDLTEERTVLESRPKVFFERKTSPLIISPKVDDKEDSKNNSNIFYEIIMETGNLRKHYKTSDNDKYKFMEKEAMKENRRKRDTTSVFLKTKNDDRIDITVQEPVITNQKQNKPGEIDFILRKGGIAIAGPGGVATAYTGGTAIVGPYGTVYKSPEGTAILGPFAKIINITDNTSFEEILRMHHEMQSEGRRQTTKHQPAKPGFKNYQNFFSYLTDLPIVIELKPQARNMNKNRPNVVRLRESEILKAIKDVKQGVYKGVIQDTPYEEKMINKNETTLIFRPKSKAEAGRSGIALSAPTSHAILFPGQKANIYFEPESVASAGPSGFAHAQSDLFVSYVRNNTPVIEPDRVNKSLQMFLQRKFHTYDASLASYDDRARSFSPVLVNPPPLSTILRPPHQGERESRQFLGYADKKRKAKPSRPIKEEGSSEEVGEEHEEENTSQTQENANEAVAISPPPEGASVAEAKPVGLAIAGPGGVAASKPQGTAVAGPGGLAIARPVGTAIAGVEVEGSVPIGGQQKNKKKPKQEAEQTETELHYVGGLTGPIGNPQPKEFADGVYYKSVREAVGNNIQDNLFFRGRHNTNGFQLKLGQQDGKYGFIPMFASPVQGTDRLQKRMDSPTYFHGLLGNGEEGIEQFPNYQISY